MVVAIKVNYKKRKLLKYSFTYHFFSYFSVFEDAVRAAGLDFHSDRLWDLYVEWEKEQGNMRNATAVLDRVLKVPTQLYNTHYDKYVQSLIMCY